MGLTLGIGGIKRHACAALSDRRQVLGVCEQERLTRVRGDAIRGTGLPDEAVDTLLQLAHATRADVGTCVLAEPSDHAGPWQPTHIDHHEAHACTAYLTSPWNAASILICDHEPPGVSVWMGNGAAISRVEWPWTGRSLSDLYSICARLVGFESDPSDQQFEALARTAAATDEPLPEFFSTDGYRISERAGWQETVLSALGTTTLMVSRARVAAALSRQLAAVASELAALVHARVGGETLCLGGSLFYHSSFNSAVRQKSPFARVFVPANPGNAGLAVGSAMRLSALEPTRVPAFMGPEYDPVEIKSTLENCKLTYTWADEDAAVRIAVEHLLQGHLVGWFEGRMEWGPRALGARSILANPFAPYVLENLNRFLKRREPWRGYALSMEASATGKHFDGPDDSPFMESDYRPRDPERFRPILPAPTAAVRVQTVDATCPPRFRRLLDAFGEAAGIPCLVNTSFNGFHEPIVCTPRDAVRVFFGSGLDVLILDQFVLTK